MTPQEKAIDQLCSHLISYKGSCFQAKELKQLGISCDLSPLKKARKAYRCPFYDPKRECTIHRAYLQAYKYQSEKIVAAIMR
jgi:hypothetical protein